MQFVFKRPSLDLSTETLAQYSGIYKLNDGTIVNIQPKNGMLTVSAGNANYMLYAASTSDFYLTSSFFKMHFMKDEKGDVSGFQLERYGSTEIAKKQN